MKACYSTKPLKNAFTKLNGEVAVCIDWKAIQIQRGSVLSDEYECTELDFRKTMLSTHYVIEQFVREKYSQSEEFSLINAYQASITGIEVDKVKEAEYLNFLAWRTSMKEQVKEAVTSYMDENPLKEDASTQSETVDETTKE